MAKPRPAKKDLEAYTIRGTTKVVRAGDCVLMRPSDTGKPPYVARIEKIEADNRNNVKVRVRWYYRPEESIGGRRQFHGAKELFLSDHYDVQSAHTIEGKCTVHSFKNYTKLENVGAEDYYCRFEYKAATGGFTPDRVAVYCKCEMPYNPDDLMVQCEGCKDWYSYLDIHPLKSMHGYWFVKLPMSSSSNGTFSPCKSKVEVEAVGKLITVDVIIAFDYFFRYHPACVGMTIEEAKKLDRFVCAECSSDDDVKKPQTAFTASSVADAKV
uniref:BAH domain-containing protein n=1 Tax=Fagus sylvatica TaxID=28930 RepID=A0A2N9H9D9_FAGSY